MLLSYQRKSQWSLSLLNLFDDFQDWQMILPPKYIFALTVINIYYVSCLIKSLTYAIVLLLKENYARDTHLISHGLIDYHLIH